METHVQIPVARGNLVGTLHTPARFSTAQQQWPLVIICHGFVGSRIGVDRLFVEAARMFSAGDFMVLRFDYAGCGESEGSYGSYSFLELVEQTVKAIDFAEQLPGVDPNQIILLGHSLGGAVATITAATRKQVKTLVLWSPVAYPFHDIVRIVGEETYREAKRSNGVDYLGYTLTDKFFDSLYAAKPLHRTKDVSGDVLVVHGSNDDVIPAKYCFYYQKAFRVRDSGTCAKEIIEGANHTFSHGPHKQKLFACTTAWMKEKTKVTSDLPR